MKLIQYLATGLPVVARAGALCRGRLAEEALEAHRPIGRILR